VLSLSAALVLELGFAIRGDGLTDDEVLYIPAGYRQLMASDYRVNPTSPPLASSLAALGLLGAGIEDPEPRPGEPEIAWAYRFVQEANDPATVIARARIPVAVLTLGLCLLLWGWTRQGHGPAAGLLALALAVFHPSLLAHGHLATTDLPAAFLILLGSWAFWRWSQAPGAWPAVLVGVSIGLAAATRLTGWLLLPSLALVAVLDGLRPQAAVRSRKALGVLTLTVGVTVPVVIWAAYGFHYAPAPGYSVSQPPAAHLSAPGQLVALALRFHALPEAYLEGARYQLEHIRQGHTAYLLGWHSKSQWWFYFLVAFLVKNTPGFLVATVLGVAVALRSGASRASTPAPPAHHWIVPAAIVFLSASTSRIQIGERYILPVYPFLILVVATTLSPLLRKSGGRWIVAAVLLVHVVPTLEAAPRGYLAYFNRLAGGPLGGHLVLLDSNLDWGQDLPRLAAWMRAHGIASVQLAYHGSDNPDRFGIRHEDLPGSHLHPEHGAPPGSTGILVISPNLLFGLVPRLADRYASLRDRPPDDRAGVFFVYKLDGAPLDPQFEGR
jgi:Dolichyl-phosphate-mannose-protein mannosyltransferase